MSALKPRVALQIDAALGETPVWSAAEQRLYWIDSLRAKVHRFDPVTGRDELLPLAGLEGYLGSMALAADGGLLLLCGKRFYRVAPGGSHAEPQTAVEADQPANNPNDGKVDPQGRFWFGTMDAGNTQPTGSLYRYDGRDVTRMDTGFACSNGLAWSPDGKTLYFVDMMPGDLLAYDFDGAVGTLSNRRVFAHFDGSEGLPDGICADAAGGLWIAHWDGACVTRYAADGKRTHKVELPAPRVTCPIFGGPALKTLFITTSGDQVIEQAPLSGSLFAFEPEVPGLPIPAFKG